MTHYNAILSNFIEKEIWVKLISPKRVSSSGEILSEVDEISEFNHSFSLYMASKLHLRVSPGMNNENLFNKIAQFQIENVFEDEIQYIMLLLQNEYKNKNYII